MKQLIAETLVWLATEGPPNGVFLLAVITEPSTWTDRAIGFVRSRFDLGGK